MPVFESRAGEEACNIFYDVKGEDASEERQRSGQKCTTSGRPDVVLIMGFGATHGCWQPQLDEGLLRPKTGTSLARCRVLLLDNRGVGASGVPEDKRAYTTTIMANDVLSLLDHLGWGKVHVVGHSMGSMVATKIASSAPSRVCSLTLVSPSGGGWQAIPKSLTALWLCLKGLFGNSKEMRAWVDVQLHFNRSMLNSVDERYGRTRQSLLHESYLEGSQQGGTGQPDYGFKGQLYAVWNHHLSDQEAAVIKEADMPIMVIHGRHDLMAAPKYGEILAARLEAPFVRLEGAHMICRERGPEINLLLHHHIFHGRRLKDTQHKFLIDDPEELPGVQPQRRSGPLAGEPPDKSPSPGSSEASASDSTPSTEVYQKLVQVDCQPAGSP